VSPETVAARPLAGACGVGEAGAVALLENLGARPDVGGRRVAQDARALPWALVRKPGNAAGQQQRRAERLLDVRLGTLDPSSRYSRYAPRKAIGTEPRTIQPTRLRLTVPLRRCTDAPTGRITTAATRSLEIAAAGLTLNRRIGIARTGHADEQPDNRAAQDYVWIHMHVLPQSDAAGCAIKDAFSHVVGAFGRSDRRSSFGLGTCFRLR